MPAELAARLRKLPPWAIPAAVGGALGLVTLLRRRSTPAAAPVQSAAPAKPSGADTLDIQAVLNAQQGAIDSRFAALPDWSALVNKATQDNKAGITDLAAQLAANQTANSAAVAALRSAVDALTARVQSLITSPVTGPATPTPAPGQPGDGAGPPAPTGPKGNAASVLPPNAPNPGPGPATGGIAWYAWVWDTIKRPMRAGTPLAPGVGVPVAYDPAADTWGITVNGVRENAITAALRRASDMVRGIPGITPQNAVAYQMANLSSDWQRGQLGRQPDWVPGTNLGWNPYALRYNDMGEAYNEEINYARPTRRLNRDGTVTANPLGLPPLFA